MPATPEDLDGAAGPDSDGLDVSPDPGDDPDERPHWSSASPEHPEVGDLLDDFEVVMEQGQLEAGEAILGELGPHAEVLLEAFGLHLGDLYETVAYAVLEDEGDHARTLRLQERAVALGCADQAGAKVALAWWLLDDGQTERGEDLFAELLDADPDSVTVRIDMGLARTDTDPDFALIAFDEAVSHALRTGDEEGLRFARIERYELRYLRGLAPDDHDRAAMAIQRAGRNEVVGRRWDDRERDAVGFFLDAELPAARERWPRLSRASTDTPEAQRRDVERTLRRLQHESPGPVGAVGLTVDEVVAAGVDPTRPRGLDDLAEARHAEGRSVAWPPGRNDPCWCASGRKYKKCCGAW